MKKGCLIVAALVVGALALIIVSAFKMTSGVVDAGNSFLALLGSGKVQEAYDSGSAQLRAQQSFDDFKGAVSKLGLSEYASASWNNRSIKNDQGQLGGSITTRSGGNIPLSMDLVKEAGTWKVLSISAPEAGVKSQNDAGKAGSVPSEKDAIKLSRETLLLFNQAIQEKNFTKFHQALAKRFADEKSADDLLKVFQPFIDKKLDLSGIRDVEPTFSDPPKLNANGMLTLNGVYPTTPMKTEFELEYLDEQGAWKLGSINVKTNVNTNAAGAAKALPSEEESARLTLETLLAFDDAIQKKDFTEFHRDISTIWQEQITPEQLRATFQAFIDQEIQISGIKALKPDFDAPPALNSDGLLVLKGSYPSKPLKVLFELKYLREQTAWKLIGLNVNVE